MPVTMDDTAIGEHPAANVHFSIHLRKTFNWSKYDLAFQYENVMSVYKVGIF